MNVFKKWIIKINTVSPSIFGGYFPSELLNDRILPLVDKLLNLGIYFGKRPIWNLHTKLKEQELNRRYELLSLDKRSHLTVDIRVLFAL